MTPNQRHCLARNPNTPPEILTKLSGDTNWGVRWEVANNHNTSPETLAKLASEMDGWIRRRVASNPNTPHETLTQLDALEAAYLVTDS